MTGPPQAATAPCAFAPWWADRVWTMNEICIIVSAPYDTVFRWHQLIRATGLFFGEKRGRDWHFDAHEMYVFRLLASFYRSGIPVGPMQVRAVVAFSLDATGAPRIPDGPLVQSAPDSEFAIDAVKIFNAVAFATDPSAEGVDAKYA